MSGRADLKLSDARVRELWADPRLTKVTMPAKAGCCYNTLRVRARALGLPERHPGRSNLRGPLFEALWRAGVASSEIAGLLGAIEGSIGRAAARAGLPPRGNGGWRPKMSLAQFQEQTRAAAFHARTAREARDMLAAIDRADAHGKERRAA